MRGAERTTTLEGQVALVTGAGRGIGRATALALAEAGASVVLGARTLEQVHAVAEEVTGRGGIAVPVELDVTDGSSVDAFVHVAADRFGRLDVLVNNAGSNTGDGAIGPLWEVDPDIWWHDVETNFRGTFLCAHHALGPMVAAGRGRIVNVVSRAATSAWPHNTAYACSKAASVRLTDSIAAEAGPHGITVFSLDPGSVDTHIWDTSVRTEVWKQWLPELVPTFAPAERPAAAVVLLASGVADALSGRYVMASQDLLELAGQAEAIVEADALQLRLVPVPGPAR